MGFSVNFKYLGSQELFDLSTELPAKGFGSAFLLPPHHSLLIMSRNIDPDIAPYS